MGCACTRVGTYVCVCAQCPRPGRGVRRVWVCPTVTGRAAEGQGGRGDRRCQAWAARTEDAEAVTLVLHLGRGFAVPQRCPCSCAGPSVPGSQAHHPRGSAAWERQHLLLCCVGNPVSQAGKPLHLCFQEFKNSWHPPRARCGRRGSPGSEDGHGGANPPPRHEGLGSVWSLGWLWPVSSGVMASGGGDGEAQAGLSRPGEAGAGYTSVGMGAAAGLCDLLHPPAGRAQGRPGLSWISLLAPQSSTEVPVAAACLTLSKNCP